MCPEVKGREMSPSRVCLIEEMPCCCTRMSRRQKQRGKQSHFPLYSSTFENKWEKSLLESSVFLLSFLLTLNGTTLKTSAPISPRQQPWSLWTLSRTQKGIVSHVEGWAPLSTGLSRTMKLNSGSLGLGGSPVVSSGHKGRRTSCRLVSFHPQMIVSKAFKALYVYTHIFPFLS